MRAVRLAAITALIGLAAASAGCRTAIKQAFSEVKGAQGEFILVQDVAPTALSPYNSFSFDAAITSAGPRICPPDLLSPYNEAARKLEQDGDLIDLYPGGPPVIRIQTEFLYSQKKGFFSAAEALARVKFLGEAGVVADGIVRAESESFLRGDNSALAEACVRAIRNFLTTRKSSEN
ncbi:MAG: hypothetical protein HRF50_06930 [Phycisphaerae bacterium]|jgi:hypothetical protein